VLEGGREPSPQVAAALEQIAHTVSRPEEVDEEIRSLFAAVSG
jgi:hypothetical protein